MSKRSGCILALLAALWAHPAIADYSPNLAEGLSKTDQQVGDVDHVNLFNGNLTIVIPIGSSYPVGGTLSYRLVLAFNANAWHFEDCSNPPDVTSCTDAEPDPKNNAGFGWTLSLGRLLTPTDPTNDAGRWVYVDPTGGPHPFYPTLHNNESADAGVFYSRDSTYVRLKLVPAGGQCSGLAAGEELEMPNGEVHRFGQDGQLVQIRDRFTNSVCVSNGASQTTIADTQGRTQTISYVSDAVFGKRVSAVTLTAFGGSSNYTFAYSTQTVQKPCPFVDPTSTFPSSVTMNLLSSVSLPDGSSYSMPSYAVSQGSSCSSPGSILSLMTPFRGKMDWTYQAYKFPAQNKIWRSSSNGVATRTTFDASGHEIGQWTYQTQLEAATFPAHPNLLTNTMRVSQADNSFAFSETHYFSVSLDSGSPWNIAEYGLPIDHYTDDGNGHPLSVQRYASDGTLLRSEYAHYDVDSLGGSDIADATQNNPRMQSGRTIYADDAQHYAEITYSSFDNIGHYRTATTGGNFEAGNVRSVTTDYTVATGSAPAPPVPVASPWVLSLIDRIDRGYVKRCVNGLKRRPADRRCSLRRGVLR
jgi:hypothetical protein